MKLWQRWLLLLIFGPICLVIVGCMAGYVLDQFTVGPKPLPFGCEHNYINSKGEDTGECQ